ncbi:MULTISPECIES: DUF4250 domain-containing protein [Clostridium]|uniref:DUF4250 domain-containing protein n=1 Tax=Clostridium cibarium TaxID=2762247 RepID=A0ABR8PX91_9CLOT|nr:MULTISPECIES: DUF4250 domain-containing protein [Clostridium]MBD7912758.1 DUF4250 domain-containing protein [Clostridium cibarium]
MNRDSLFSMDPDILLSILNLKLRDNFSSIEELCEDIGVTESEIAQKLESTGRIYNRETNQFK